MCCHPVLVAAAVMLRPFRPYNCAWSKVLQFYLIWYVHHDLADVYDKVMVSCIIYLITAAEVLLLYLD